MANATTKMTKQDRYAQLMLALTSAACNSTGARRDDLNRLLGEVTVYAEYSHVFKVAHLDALEIRARALGV